MSLGPSTMGPTSREDLPQKLQVVTRLPRLPPWELLDPWEPELEPPVPPGGFPPPLPPPVRLEPGIARLPLNLLTTLAVSIISRPLLARNVSARTQCTSYPRINPSAPSIAGPDKCLRIFRKILTLLSLSCISGGRLDDEKLRRLTFTRIHANSLHLPVSQRPVFKACLKSHGMCALSHHFSTQKQGQTPWRSI